MTERLPLDQIRLNWKSHGAALRWIWLAFRKPGAFGAEAGQRLKAKVSAALIAHALPYFLLLFFLSFNALSLPWLVLSLCIAIGSEYALGLASEISFGVVGGLSAGFLLGAIYAINMPAGSTQEQLWALAAGLVVGATCSLLDIGAVVIGLLLLGWTIPPHNLYDYDLSKATATLVILALGGLAFFGRVNWDLAILTSVSLAAVYGLAAQGPGFRSKLELVSVCMGWWIGFLRLPYLPIHTLLLIARRKKSYRHHPLAWDDVCLFPFPGLDRLLVGYATHDPVAGEREIDRLIDTYPSQRNAALRARAILIARRAAETQDLARLDEALAGLPEGKRGFLKETAELRRRTHEITSLQARIDTLDRPFLREPYAALLLKEIESFEQQIAGFRPPLSTEFRKAARNWAKIARSQYEETQAAVSREPTRQVFRAGDPVNREQEAFVLRAGILGELERQVMLASGCPGLLVYGRRRMGKSSLLRNLTGFLPPRVAIANLSMQDARAFTSTTELVGLIHERIAVIVPKLPPTNPDLVGLGRLLAETDKRLEADDRRLLLAFDEYENLDRKIGEGVFPKTCSRWCANRSRAIDG